MEEFIKTGESNYVYALSEAYEEIIPKYPSERLEYLFDKFDSLKKCILQSKTAYAVMPVGKK